MAAVSHRGNRIFAADSDNAGWKEKGNGKSGCRSKDAGMEKMQKFRYTGESRNLRCNI